MVLKEQSQKALPHKVGAVIVTYFPDNEIETRICAALSQVEDVIIVDNASPEIDRNRLIRIKNAYKNIILILNVQNEGLARALNQGCRYLFDKKYKYALLLDQDSTITDGMVTSLTSLFRSENVAVAGPMIYPSNIPIDEIGYKLKYMVKTNSVLYKKKFVADEPLEVAFNITSGSVLDLDIWESVKGMWEKLFIEGIDTEYCLRVNTLGYKVLIDNKSKLLQAYGNQTSVSFFGKNFFPTNHNPLRHYYRAKNRILIWKRHLIKHPYYLSWDILSLLNSLFLILFFEERKFEKIKCIVKGTIDGLSN